MPLRKKNLDYKWVILVICFLMEFLCLGFCSSNTGLYTKAVTQALGIKRSLYSLAYSSRFVTQVLTALFFGTLVNRFGVRKMVCLGLVCLTSSVILRGVATVLLHLLISSILWGIGTVFVGGTMAGTIVRRWFHQNVGRYTGIVMSANGIGGAIAAQIISPLINNGETFGYRKAYLLSAAISLVISIVIMIFLREHPDDGPAAQTAGGKKQPKGNLWLGFSYGQIKRKPYFYATAAMVFLTGISIQSIGSISVVYMSDIGLSDGFVAATATVSSLCLTFSKILVGTAYDKIGLRYTLLLCLSCAILAFLLKAFLTASVTGMLLAMIACILSIIASPLETVMLPLLSGDLFGSQSYAKVLGVFMAMNSLGLCLGTPLGDLCFDLWGTYQPCFWFFAGIMAAVVLGYQFVLRSAYRDKSSFLSQTQSLL